MVRPGVHHQSSAFVRARECEWELEGGWEWEEEWAQEGEREEE
jgi:hypothetical protein